MKNCSQRSAMFLVTLFASTSILSTYLSRQASAQTQLSNHWQIAQGVDDSARVVQQITNQIRKYVPNLKSAEKLAKELAEFSYHAALGAKNQLSATQTRNTLKQAIQQDVTPNVATKASQLKITLSRAQIQKIAELAAAGAVSSSVNQNRE